MSSSCPYESHEKLNSCPVNSQSSSFDTNTNLPSDLQKSLNNNSAILSTERTESSIPRASSTSTWTYPSPRMFYNALRRKGFETRPEDIHSMLQVHNFLNEQVWTEVMKWEASHSTICSEPKLKRFMGRPKDLSPRARFFNFFYGTPKPFDRHDWTIDRCGREVRYVIDYYSGPKEEEGTFYCDVRPALDSWEAFCDRTRVFWNQKHAELIDPQLEKIRELLQLKKNK